MSLSKASSIPTLQESEEEVSWVPVTPLKPSITNLLPTQIEVQNDQPGEDSLLDTKRLESSSPQEDLSTVSSIDSTNSVEPSTCINNLKKTSEPKSQRPVEAFGKFSINPLKKWEKAHFAEFLALPNASSTTLEKNHGMASHELTTLFDVPIIGHQQEMSSTELLELARSSTCIEDDTKRVAPQNGLFMPQQPTCNLNTLARSSSEADKSKMATQFTLINPGPKRLDKKGFSVLAQITIEPPNQEKDSSRVVSQFAPMTPNQSKRVQNQVSVVLHTVIEERKNQEKDGSIDAVATIVAINEHDDKKAQQIVTDLSSSGLKENHNPDKGDNHLDLNQTSQQRPRRRKHRPRVITEGKPRGKPRTPKPAKMKPIGTPEKPTGKRKYVRKKPYVKRPKTPSAKAEVIDGNQETTGVAKRSCRKALNFDIKDETRERETQDVGNFELQSLSTVQLCQEMELQGENTRAGIAYDLTHSMNQILKDYIVLPEEEIQSKINRTNQLLRSALHEEITTDRKQQINSTAKFAEPSLVLQTSKAATMLEPKLKNSIRSSTSSVGAEKTRGLKRGCSCTIEQAGLSMTNMGGALYNSIQTYQIMLLNPEANCGRIPGMHFPEIYKKKRSEKVHSSASTASGTLCETVAESNQRQATCPKNNTSANPFPFPSKANCRISDYQFCTINSPVSHGESVSDLLDRVHSMEQFLALGCAQGLTKKRSMKALVADTGATMSKRKRTRKHASSTYSTNGPQLQENVAERNDSQLLSRTNGSPLELMWKEALSVEIITEHLRCLNINGEGNRYTTEYNTLVPYYIEDQEQSAMVLYHRDGTVVPFDSSLFPFRKRKPRPKVDLDEETTRVWKLLLENIDNEGIDGTDEEKVKWWDDERRVFRGRADSFIARMHLVQGDRRFSPWKGSVLDSVIGVFLTQNVSDHLSSSAFMSLAARFPLASRSNLGTGYKAGKNVFVEEPDLDPGDCQPEPAISWHENNSDQTVCHQSSITVHKDVHGEETVVSYNKHPGNSIMPVKSAENNESKLLDSGGGDAKICDEMTMNYSTTVLVKAAQASVTEKIGEISLPLSENCVVSSQTSVDYLISQGVERIGSCSESNSEDVTGSSKSETYNCSASFVEPLSIENSIEGQNRAGNMEYDEPRQEMGSCDGQSESATIIPPSICHGHLTADSGEVQIESIESIKVYSLKKDENCGKKETRSTTECVHLAAIQLKMTSDVQEAHKSSSQKNSSCSNFQGEVNGIFQSKDKIGWESNDNKSMSQVQCNKKQQNLDLPNFSHRTLEVAESTNAECKLGTEQKEVESNLNKFSHSSDVALSGTKSDTLKSKRVRTAKEKRNDIDWDYLRKQAEAGGRKRERTANTVDSLDYEAVRLADVNEIANAIKERGMNNKLAERIKDFLNRLVKEHGSINLEWLRDVHPDKAKEYLLSIRGLGLKSVECVRLLTLHHLAFPVDTNVGRIAVRLGWVPLQPLPESLQLHLLELYPVLESIQQYLWPRLCKLDQRTLYELHYQMITFGKVFCTKSKPNCNACPMRGECRHFASAFASARLALPGPEERSIVSAAENTEPVSQDPPGIAHALTLLPSQAEQKSEPNIGNGNSEPIIEVPSTPEPKQTQMSELDIEDTYCQDPDEIPTIKLNIEQFTQNIQNYMQENMELEETEMSKALVALTPEVASIPVPKLKNISRLRTEHQVYELPDSHPLLEGLDKREPDDPCSYLLAIWTPGETVDSIEPPERKCSSQELGKLCDEMTCFSCNSIRETNSQTVRGTLLIPCRTAMRGSFPLNGTYFQVNEVFADHDSSLNPIDVPRAWIWNLPRRTVYFGTSIPTIFKGLSTENIQYCFWRGFVCVRGFDQKTRAPRPLIARLHFPASKMPRAKGGDEKHGK
ncbi:Permuted single zf-CXXC unit [Dillenia turbinata]|uniref:Permuted single zf-CXXC unit n=1 Tax=Dillenia turbinata TaxID=194707 RepID=A0AAN8ZR14_9MAGN